MKRTKKIKELFAGSGESVSGAAAEISVSGVQFDSRRVQAGDLFVAVRGFKTDGHRYLPVAHEKGALAAVVEEISPEVPLPQIQVKNARRVLAYLGANFYRPEIDALTLIGITGTNGKTTTSYLVRSVLQNAGWPCGLLGTIQYQIGSQTLAAWNTTPEAADVAAMLFQMARENFKACVMEISSHALALNRVDGLRFAVGVFTNLTRDHLDFHKTFEDYFASKCHLFDLLLPDGTAVVNMDDEYGKKAIDRIRQTVLTFGQNPLADVHPLKTRVTLQGIEMTCATPFGSIDIRSALTGDFNVQNILAAVAVGLALHIPLNAIRAGIASVTHVPGRLESYEIKPGVRAVIDYAHTPDSLQKALKALRPMTEGRLLVVFGAGGDRDRGKRPLMGQVAESLADVVFVTSDNPRNEDPQKIIDDIVQGMHDAGKRRVILDRKEAIFAAVQEARPGDVLLVAGKGHETYQIIKGKKFDFDEVAILKEAAKRA